MPVPEANVAGLVVGWALQAIRPWPLPTEPPVRLTPGGSSGDRRPRARRLGGPRHWPSGRRRAHVAGDGRAVPVQPEPTNVGWTAGSLGFAVLTRTTWLLILFAAVALVVHRGVRREERALEATFGDDSRRYRRAVHRYL